MPTMAELMADGVKGQNGLLQGFPPNTGVGWYTLATGTWPGEHGSTNNTFHRTGETQLQQPHVARRDRSSRPTRSSRRPSARARRSPPSSGSALATPGAAGPGHRLPQLLLDPRRPRHYAPVAGEQAGADAFGVSYQRSPSLAPASGWTNTPAPATTAREPAAAARAHGRDDVRGREPDRIYDVYIYDSVGQRRPRRTTTSSLVPATGREERRAAGRQPRASATGRT